MTGVLAYLPQYVGDVSGIVFGASFAIEALPALIAGRSPFAPFQSARTVRVGASLVVTAGIGLALLVVFVLVSAEPPGGYPGAPGGRWGTTASKVVMGIWILVITAVAGRNLTRELRFLRTDSPN